MKIELGVFIYKLSIPQARVVEILINKKDRFVIPTDYYNHQDIKGENGFFKQFKKPTLDFLRKHQILIPNGEKNYLKINPLVKIAEE